MSDRLRQIMKDVLLVGSVFAVLSGSYYGFAVAERYRALTRAYVYQADQLATILNNQIEAARKPGE